MANKYTALKIPPKEDLESLYFGDFRTQKEIGEVYGTTQKVVFSWFRKHNIKSRIPYKRDQRREKNSFWKGEKATYAAYHYRVKSIRGKACFCENCGEADPSIRYEWANMTGKYADINDYKSMCCSCHKIYDRIGQNFRIKRINKRQLVDGKL
jgi:hypothetical protein